MRYLLALIFVFNGAVSFAGGTGGHTSLNILAQVELAKGLVGKALYVLDQTEEKIMIHGKEYHPQELSQHIDFEVVVCKEDQPIYKRGSKISVCDKKLSEFSDSQDNDTEVFAVAYPDQNKVFFNSKMILEISNSVNRNTILFSEVFHELAHISKIGEGQKFSKGYNEHAELSKVGYSLIERAFEVKNQYLPKQGVKIHNFLCIFPIPGVKVATGDNDYEYLLIKAWEHGISLNWYEQKIFKDKPEEELSFLRNFSRQLVPDKSLGDPYREVLITNQKKDNLSAVYLNLTWSADLNSKISIATLKVPPTDEDYEPDYRFSSEDLTLFNVYIGIEFNLQDVRKGKPVKANVPELQCLTMPNFVPVEEAVKYFNNDKSLIIQPKK